MLTSTLDERDKKSERFFLSWYEPCQQVLSKDGCKPIFVVGEKTAIFEGILPHDLKTADPHLSFGNLLFSLGLLDYL